MKRPLALIGFTYFISLVACTYFGAGITTYIAVVMFCLFLLSLLIKRIRLGVIIPLALITSTIACSVYSIYNYKAVSPIYVLDGKKASINGTICEAPYKSDDRYYYIVQTDSIDTQDSTSPPQKIKIRLSSDVAIDADYFSQISANVRFFKPVQSNNFHSKTYHASNGIHMLAYIVDYDNVIVKPSAQKPLYYYSLKIREKLIYSINSLLPKPESGIAEALILGSKHNIDDQLKEEFTDVGIYHVLVVSGIHVTIISQFLLALFIFFKVPKRFAALFTAICIFGFMSITGFSPSVMRAGIMIIIYLFGVFISRQSDSLNSLGAAVLLISIINPFSGGSIGLQLSVLSVLGILILHPKIKKWLKDKTIYISSGKRMLNFVISDISISMSVILFTLPVMIIAQRRVYIMSIISNMLIIIPTEFALILTMLSSIINLIPIVSFIAKPIALGAGLIIKYMIWCVHLLYKIPFSSISAAQPFVLLWLSGTLIIIAICFTSLKTKELLKISSILSFIILLVGIISYQISMRNVTRVALLDVGDSCAVAITKNRDASLIACDTTKFDSYNIRRYLKDNNVKQLQCLVVPSKNKKTYECLSTVCKNYPPKSVLAPDNSLSDDIENVNLEYITFNESSEVSLWDNVSLYIKNIDKCSYVYMTVNDIDFLISSDNLPKNIAQDYNNCHFFVTSNLKQDYSYIDSIYTIFSINPWHIIRWTDPNDIEDKLLITTAANGNVLVDVYDKNNVCIRRGN